MAFCLAVMFLLVFRPAAAIPLELGSEQAYDIGGHLSVLKDPSCKMTFDEVLAKKQSGGFLPLAHNLNAGYARSAFWVHLAITGGEGFPETGWLRLMPSFTEEVTVYVSSKGGHHTSSSAFRKVELGSHMPALQRPLLLPDFVIPVPLVQHKPVDIYIRVYSNSSISLSGQVHTYDSIWRTAAHDIMFQSAYLGIAFVIFIVNMILFVLIRDRLFLFFALYILIDFFNNIGVEGMLTLVYPSHVHTLNDILVYMGIGAKVLVFSEFSYMLFREFVPFWTQMYLRSMSLIGFLTIVAVPFGVYPLVVPWTFSGLIIMIFILLWQSWRMAFLMPSTGRLMFLAFAISAAGYVFQLLRLLGFIPLDVLRDINTIQPAALIHMLLISMALAERLRAAERQSFECSRQAERKAVVIAEEMTKELRENKERLEIALESEHMALEQQQQFLSMVSHEYRTPLAIIQGALDILSVPSEINNEAEPPEFEKMRRAVTRLVDLMDVSLEQSRFMDPHSLDKLIRFNVADFVRQQADAARWMWPDRSFSLDCALMDEWQFGEMTLLGTVLFNLLENAHKYSPDGSLIEIACRKTETSVQISITNSSEKFDTSESDMLFEKYRRGKNSYDTTGAGIGLWLVRTIIERHGGTVALKPMDEGQVRLIISLPVLEP